MEDWHPNTEDLQEAMYDYAFDLINCAIEENIPVWDMREQFIKVFDDVAENINAEVE